MAASSNRSRSAQSGTTPTKRAAQAAPDYRAIAINEVLRCMRELDRAVNVANDPNSPYIFECLTGKGAQRYAEWQQTMFDTLWDSALLVNGVAVPPPDCFAPTLPTPGSKAALSIYPA